MFAYDETELSPSVHSFTEGVQFSHHHLFNDSPISDISLAALCEVSWLWMCGLIPVVSVPHHPVTVFMSKLLWLLQHCGMYWDHVLFFPKALPFCLRSFCLPSIFSRFVLTWEFLKMYVNGVFCFDMHDMLYVNHFGSCGNFNFTEFSNPWT